MLGKVFKTDFKANARLFVPLYICIAVITAIAKASFELGIRIDNPLVNFISATSMVLYVIALIALSVMPVVFIVIRFYKNFLTDEAYLTFTIPVKTSTLVFSKQINGVLWMLLSVVVLVAAFFGMFCNYIFADLDEIRMLFRMFVQEVSNIFMTMYGGAVDNMTIPLTVIAMVLSVVFSFSNLYACMALGQMYSKHKIAGSIIAYIAIYFVMNMLSGVAAMLVVFTDSFNAYLIYSIVQQLVTGCAFLAITIYMLKNKLNLD